MVGISGCHSIWGSRAFLPSTLYELKPDLAPTVKTAQAGLVCSNDHCLKQNKVYYICLIFSHSIYLVPSMIPVSVERKVSNSVEICY